MTDVRLGLRALRRGPAYAASMLVTLALVIGATISIFALVRGVLLSPLPYPEADRLVVAWERNVPRERAENVVSVPMFEAWRERARTLAEAAALVPDRQTLTDDGPERVEGAAVTASWFDVVGVPPVLGRGFTEEEARAGGVVVISNGLWRDRFGADPEIVGRTIPMTGTAHTVIGIMPEGFEPPAFGWLGPEQRYWVPFAADEANRTWGRFLLVLGRLAAGATPELADAELAAIMSERALENGSLRDWTADVVPLHEQVTGPVEAPLLILLFAVSCLLLVGLVNVTNLVLLRLRQRDLEFGVRAALGADRGRLGRQLRSEALAIMLIAAPLGLLIGWAGLRGLSVMLPTDIPRAHNVRLDRATLAVGSAVAVIATLALSIVPALQLSIGRLHERLRAGGARVTAGSRGRPLIVAQVALALVLAVGAGLAMRSFIALRAVPLGFDPTNVVAFRVALPGAYESDEARGAFFERLLERISAAPGVEAAGAVNIRPLGGSGVATNVTPLGGTGQSTELVADIRVATPGYLSTVGIQLLAGDGIGTAGAAGPRGAVVNATMARELWPGRSPVGERFVLAMNPPDTVRVAGVVDDVRLGGPSVELRPTVYLPHAAEPSAAMDVVLRTRMRTAEAIAMARGALAELDASLPLYDAETLERSVDQITARQRVELVLLAAFTILALFLAATGIYGVLAMEVGARRGEIAVRMALGATPGHVSVAIFRDALGVAMVGLVLGVGGALILTRWMRSMLFGIQPDDPITYLAVAVLLMAVSMAAAWLPARRAAAIEPMRSMRAE